MIAEGIIAMIWAAASMSLFGGYDGLNEVIAAGGPATVVSEVSLLMLGSIGGTLAVLGVIVLPVTSGDTAFRAARMIIAEYFKFGQAKLLSRLWIAIPLFVISYGLTKIDFNILWRYFSWANQVTAVIALWVGAMYLFLARKNYWIATIPATFMTYMVIVYILYEPTMGFGIPLNASFIGGVVATIAILAVFFNAAHKKRGTSFLLDEDVSGYQIASTVEQD